MGFLNYILIFLDTAPLSSGDNPCHSWSCRSSHDGNCQRIVHRHHCLGVYRYAHCHHQQDCHEGRSQYLSGHLSILIKFLVRLHSFQITDDKSDKAGVINDGFDSENGALDEETEKKLSPGNSLDTVTFIKEQDKHVINDTNDEKVVSDIGEGEKSIESELKELKT